MLRRKPTRIDLKLEDMEEYETLKKEAQQQQTNRTSTSTILFPIQQPTQQSMDSRIGFISNEPISHPVREL
jgi:hypothetical protein